MQQFDVTPDIQDFRTICTHTCEADAYPLCREITDNVVCYDGELFRASLEETKLRKKLQTELIEVLDSGPGVFTISKAYTDLNIIDEANNTFDALLAQYNESGGADHFAEAGTNGRLWNAFQKHAIHNPANFIQYYKNPVLDIASSAWLGPYYQVTTQVNIVRPGGQAQSPHRDYHLGFQPVEALYDYPLHVHEMSAKLTLQGAVAHSDMPLTSGPTLLLPYSQKYKPGFISWQRDDFKEYFFQNCVQLPLKKGDALFFNPALFHAAGTNHTSNIHRRANLFQISSVFGKPMESVDLALICESVYEALKSELCVLSDDELDCILGCISDGYPFPTNLDTDPPTGGLAPQSHRQLLQNSLINENLSLEEFRLAQSLQAEKRKP